MLETIRLRMKALFELICFGKSFQSFPNLIGGISHFTPLPMGEGTGVGPVGWPVDWLMGPVLYSSINFLYLPFLISSLPSRRALLIS